MSLYNIHEDPYFPSENILKGLRGFSYIDSGYIYNPYIPTFISPTAYRLSKVGVRVHAKSPV